MSGDRAALYEHADAYLDALTRRDPSRLGWADDAVLTENNVRLAVGDGMMTDVKGGADNGFDVLYVSGGIHARDYGEPLAPDPALLAAFLDKHGYHPVAMMPRLR